MPPSPAQQRRLLQYFIRGTRRHPDWPVLISEGDSWFSFPVHANTIDFIDERAGRQITLLRLEKSGDKAIRIFSGKQKKRLATYLMRYPVQAVLFSGGGNDIVGEDILALLNQRRSGMTWRECINEKTTTARFQAVRSAYLDLVHLRNENRPGCRIYVHGYDWAVPSGRGARLWGIKFGPWMKPNLEAKGIVDPGDQRKIIRELLRRFNAMIREIATEPGVVHVKTTGTLTESEWNDELHPSRAGFRKIAGKFCEKLALQFPDTF